MLNTKPLLHLTLKVRFLIMSELLNDDDDDDDDDGEMMIRMMVILLVLPE